MKKLLFFLFGFVFTLTSFGQGQSFHRFSSFDSVNLGVGYYYNFEEPNERNFHLLSIELNKTTFGGHASGFQYGIGSEIGLNTFNFLIGPKINGMLIYQGIALGGELVTYTDFREASLRFVPVFGLASDRFKLTINPHLILINDNFQPVNRVSVNVSINLALHRQIHQRYTEPNTGDKDGL